MTSRLRTTETDGREMVRAILRGVSVCPCVCVSVCVRAGGGTTVDPWLRVCSAVRQCKAWEARVSLAGADNRIFPRARVWHGGVGFGTIWVGGLRRFRRGACNILRPPGVASTGRHTRTGEASHAAQTGKAMLRLGLHATRARAPFRPLVSSCLVAPGPLELIAVARHSSTRGASLGSRTPRSARTRIHIPSVQLMARAHFSTEAQTTYFAANLLAQRIVAGMRMTVFHIQYGCALCV